MIRLTTILIVASQLLAAQQSQQINFRTLDLVKNHDLGFNHNTIMFLNGRYDPSDGKGGIYWFDTTSSTIGTGNDSSLIRTNIYTNANIKGGFRRWENNKQSYYKPTWAEIVGKPVDLSLTTTGNSGAATYNNSTGVLNIPNYTSKRREPYTVTTGSNGEASVTYGTAFSVEPNLTFDIKGGLVTQNVLLIASSTTGFTIKVQNRVDVIGLLPTYTNVNGAVVNIQVMEK